jgi:hypothetical protein
MMEPKPPAADPELVAAGWERRFLAAADRVEEAVELYRSLGLEIKAEPLGPSDFGPDCQDCASEVCRSYLLIYTRKPSH